MKKTLFITNKVIAAYAEAMLNLLNEEGMDFVNVRNCHETIKFLLSGITPKNLYYKGLTQARRNASLYLSLASIDEEDRTVKDNNMIADAFKLIKNSLSGILNMSGINYWKAFAAGIQQSFDEYDNESNDFDVEDVDIRIATLNDELNDYRDDAKELAELEEQLEEFNQRLEEIENNEF